MSFLVCYLIGLLSFFPLCRVLGSNSPRDKVILTIKHVCLAFIISLIPVCNLVILVMFGGCILCHDFCTQEFWDKQVWPRK